MKPEKLIAILLFAAISFSARADWLINTYRNGNAINNLSDADALISSTAPIASTNLAVADLLGYSTGEGTGHFTINAPVPGLPQNQPTDNYAVQGTGFFVVTQTGNYSFGLNTDDGARLKIDGVNVIIDDGIHPPRDSTYATITLTAGAHAVEWTWFNAGGGAEAEVFLAAGNYTSFTSNFTLLAANRSPVADLSGGLIAYYRFDGNANDASGNNVSGTAYNSTFAPGYFDLGLSVNGNPNSFVEVQSNELLEPTNAVSVSLWFNQHSLPPGQFACLLYKANSTLTSGFADRSYSLWVTPGGGEIHFTSTASGAASQTAIYTSSGLFGLNEWVHVVGIVDASNQQMSVYVNGNLAGTAVYPSKSILSGNYPLRIGSFVNYSGGDQAGFNGVIDEVRIYNRVLSASEIQALHFSPMTVVQTNRTPTTAEITSLLAALPTTSQLLAFHGGIFTTNLASVNPNKMTVVFTHGWNSNPNDWPSNMASFITANVSPVPNLVAWDWSYVAKADLPGIPEAQTGDQGRILGEKLLLALGANYTNKIQFIGHSLGTLVNASAANYLQGTNWASESVSPFPWPATNMLMTLFDEAEAATGITTFSEAIDTLLGKNGNPLLPKKAYDHPLPKQFVWAENYVAAFGLLHPEAANVILTNNFPTAEPNGFSGWRADLTAFHAYPMDWYDPTIQTVNSAMGFVWPFLWSLGDPAFTSAPSAGSVYIQSGSPYNLLATNWTFGTNFLNGRFQAYRNALAYALTGETPDSVAVNGSGNAQYVVGAYPAVKGLYDDFIMTLLTTPANATPLLQIKAHPLGATPNDSSSNTNIPAFAWIPLTIPANAVSMSFDYIIQGDWASDSLAAAFNGTNCLLIAGNTIQTNVTFTSGPIDVSAFAGQTNEFFIGIVGGTSTNAQVTIQNLAFSISAPPLLQAQTGNGNLILSWPLSAADYVLQTSTNLTDTNSWTAVPNVPAIVNLQNTVTNPISGAAKFYRLKK